MADETEKPIVVLDAEQDGRLAALENAITSLASRVNLLEEKLGGLPVGVDGDAIAALDTRLKRVTQRIFGEE